MVLKPYIGALSDRWGRRRLLLIATMVFLLVPLLYVLLADPRQLIGLRILHGLGTAIYGPVMGAMIADVFTDTDERRLRYGWYDTFKSAGYVIGPFLGGCALSLIEDPRYIYVAIALISLGAVLPALRLPNDSREAVSVTNDGWSLHRHLRISLRTFRHPNWHMAIATDSLTQLLTRGAKLVWSIWALQHIGPIACGAVILNPVRCLAGGQTSQRLSASST